MPSPSLPWMTQRLKWETTASSLSTLSSTTTTRTTPLLVDEQTDKADENDRDDDAPIDERTSATASIAEAAVVLTYQSGCHMSARQLEQRWNLSSDGCWTMRGDDDDEPRIHIAAVACPNGNVQVVCRECSSDVGGRLVSVLWSHGVWKR